MALGRKGSWRTQPGAAPLLPPHITLGACSSGHVIPHSLLSSQAQGPSWSGFNRLANFVFPFPKGFSTSGPLHMLFHCLDYLGIQRCI